MQLRELKRFLAVVDFGSINKAAAHLNVSQPSLTKDIHALEERLGFALFSRTARGVKLTTFGESILQRARLIDAELRRLDEDARALRNVSMGEVHVGVVPGFLQSLVLPQATLNLVRRATRLQVNYRFGTRASLIKPLLAGALDFAIVGIEDDAYSADLVSEPLVLDRNTIVVRSGHPILFAGRQQRSQLVQYPWLVQSECELMERAMNRMVMSWGTPFAQSIVRADSFHFFRNTLVSSDCIGLARYDTVRVEQEVGNVVELPLNEAALAPLLATHMVGFVRRRDSLMSAASQALMQEIAMLTGIALKRNGTGFLQK